MANARSRRRWLALALLAALGYALAVLWDRPRGATGAWLQRAGLRARRAQVGGRWLRFVRAGSGTPVVLIHGFASSLYTWSETLPALARRHDVVALDLPGFGEADLPADLIWPELPRSVLGLMDRLGLPRAAVVGHSLGGAVALTLAAREPQRVDRLVLIDAAGFNLTPSERPALIRLAASPTLGVLAQRLPVRRLLLHVGLRQVFHDDARITGERVEEYLAPLSRSGWLPAMRSLALSREQELVASPSLLAEVTAPTLVVWGREDEWTPVDHARRFHAGIHGSRLVVFDACGHVPQEERPQDALRVLAEFLGDAAP